PRAARFRRGPAARRGGAGRAAHRRLGDPTRLGSARGGRARPAAAGGAGAVQAVGGQGLVCLCGCPAGRRTARGGPRVVRSGRRGRRGRRDRRRGACGRAGRRAHQRGRGGLAGRRGPGVSRHCLAEQFGGFVCDLDGVIYRGQHAVPGAVEALDAVSAPVVYATNNASGTPEEFARRLQGHGVHVQPEQVLTSSLAAARVLSRQLTSGAPVMAIGGPGVAASLRAVGLGPREPADGSAVDAVVQGYGSSVTAGDLGHAAAAIRGGARWIATNEDRTLPTDDGVAPGNGALVAALSMAVDVAPEVIGKPHPPMYE